jgi:hypothetical protein
MNQPAQQQEPPGPAGGTNPRPDHGDEHDNAGQAAPWERD